MLNLGGKNRFIRQLDAGVFFNIHNPFSPRITAKDNNARYMWG